MIRQKAISLKVYEDLLEQFDAQLELYEKRNQAINKAMMIYVELKKWREKIDLESDNTGQKTAMEADAFHRLCRISKRWRVG